MHPFGAAARRKLMQNTAFKKNLKIAQYALFSAIVIAMNFVPYIGYISYGGLSITLIHIPVIVGACVLGVSGGLTLGTVWGVSCLIKAVLAPPTPLEGIIFRNPIVSILPRILMGLFAALVFKALKKHWHIASVSAVLVGCLTNTCLVMGSIYLLYCKKYGPELGIASVNFGGLTNYVLAAFTINAVVEIISAIVITLPVVRALKKQLNL